MRRFRDEKFVDITGGVDVLKEGLLTLQFAPVLQTFSKRVKNVVTSKGIEVGIECK